MTNQEFSNEFDVLYNNIMSNSAPGLDEYEKSIFLTKAQNEIIKNYFTSTQNGNKYNEGFEDSQKRLVDFSKLVTVSSCIIPYTSYEGGFTYTGSSGYFKADVIITGNNSSSIYDNHSNSIPVRGSINVVFMSTNVDSPTARGTITINNSNELFATIVVQTPRSTSFVSEDNLKTAFKDITLTGSYNISITVTEFDKGDGGEFTPTASQVATTDNSLVIKQSFKYTDSHLLINFPYNFFLYISGEVTLDRGGKTVMRQQVPIKYDEYIRVMSKPYRNSIKRQIYSISANSDLSYGGNALKKNAEDPTTSGISPLLVNGAIELILPYNEVFKSYKLRYVRYPVPIILEDLKEAGLSIQGESAASSCELGEEIHPEILQRAVELAKATYVGDVKSIVELGQRSE